jgi:arginase
MRPVSLIGAASGWGAGFRETESGPPVLRELGLAERLREAGIEADWQAMIEPERRWRQAPEQPYREILRLVARHNSALAAATAAAVGKGRLPVVLGGDHSVAIGTWGGVAGALRQLRGPDAALGLIWFDAHLDSHTADTTPSMNPHGMSGAVLLGHGEPEFLAIGGRAVRPENLCFIGTRSYEADELALLKRLGVRIVFMDELRQRGVADVMTEAIVIATKGTAGFGVTIDLDGFEPEDAPGIGLKTANGLRRDEMLLALAGLGLRQDLVGVEIVEYIPEFDENWRTAHLVIDLLLALLTPDRVLPHRNRGRLVDA